MSTHFEDTLILEPCQPETISNSSRDISTIAGRVQTETSHDFFWIYSFATSASWSHATQLAYNSEAKDEVFHAHR